MDRALAYVSNWEPIGEQEAAEALSEFYMDAVPSHYKMVLRYLKSLKRIELDPFNKLVSTRR